MAEQRTSVGHVIYFRSRVGCIHTTSVD